MNPGELRGTALAALCAAEPAAKVVAVHALAAAALPADPSLVLVAPAGVPGRPPRPLLVRPGALAPRPAGTTEGRAALLHALAAAALPADPSLVLVAPAGVPGRPPRPLLVRPGALAPRPAGTTEGRAALLHALAHIEFNAINLALDAVWRFAGMPADYYADWLRVADEEATHFTRLGERLAAHGAAYGDFPAHDGLWEMAEKTSGDVLARMALVPRTLEARGLDASPAIRAKFAAAGDEASARVIDVILRDEIGHVAIGNRWFRALCAQRRLDAGSTFTALAAQFGAPRLRGPFNLAARRAAGFSDEELRMLGS